MIGESIVQFYYEISKVKSIVNVHIQYSWWNFDNSVLSFPINVIEFVFILQWKKWTSRVSWFENFISKLYFLFPSVFISFIKHEIVWFYSTVQNKNSKRKSNFQFNFEMLKIKYLYVLIRLINYEIVCLYFSVQIKNFKRTSIFQFDFEVTNIKTMFIFILMCYVFSFPIT